MSLLVILSVAATIAVNALANALPINGQTTGEISNRQDVLFTPASYVFAIWGLIYVGLIAFAIFQALPSQKANPRLRRARPWLAASGLANIAWILLWHYEQFALTMVVMLALLLTLVLTYLRLEVGRAPASGRERWLLQVPVGIYLGWVSVATIANAASLLWVLGWDGFGLDPAIWTVVMIAVALLIGGSLALQRGDRTVPLVLAWAFVGIAIRNAATPTLSISAWLAAGMAAFVAILALRRPQPAGPPSAIV
jgi:hypothetical protein